MLDRKLCEQVGLTESEISVLELSRTPEEFQQFINENFPYDYEEDGIDNYQSFRTVLKEKKAHCWAGMVMGAAYIFLNNLGPPLIMRIEASDMPHQLAVYWKDGKVGSLGASRHTELTGKSPRFNSYRDLVMSYYPHYYNDITNDKNDLTMRGIGGPIDLRMFGTEWLTADRDLTEIVDYLDGVPYSMLFPNKPELYKDFKTVGKFYFL